VAPQVGINMDTQAFHPADLRTLGERFGPIAGGLVMLAGTLLPWLEVHRPVPVGLYAETGLQTLSGQISFGAGVLVVVAGVGIAIVPKARVTGLLAMAAGTVIAAATVTEWSIRLLLRGESPAAGVAVTSAGVLISLVAAYLALGETRWRSTLITAVIVLCSAAVTIAPELPDPVPPIPDTGMG
jgi:hypothetical protein